MALFSKQADLLSLAAPGQHCDHQASPPHRKTRPAGRFSQSRRSQLRSTSCSTAIASDSTGHNTPTSYSGSESEVPSRNTSTAASAPRGG
eukprot:1291006-Rhodomonas_salina.1